MYRGAHSLSVSHSLTRLLHLTSAPQLSAIVLSHYCPLHSPFSYLSISIICLSYFTSPIASVQTSRLCRSPVVSAVRSAASPRRVQRRFISDTAPAHVLVTSLNPLTTQPITFNSLFSPLRPCQIPKAKYTSSHQPRPSPSPRPRL
jgi:hypothetical protein